MKETLTRALSGALYVILLLVVLWLPNPYLFKGLFFIFGLFGVYELQKLLGLKSYLSYLIFVIFYLFFSVLDSDEYLSSSTLILNTLLVLTLLIKSLLLRDLVIVSRIPLFEEKKYLVVIFYLISSFIFITRIPFFNGDYEPLLLLGIFIMIWTNDTFAYLVGKSIGKRKLFERISPKKTVEGFLGGFIFTLITAIILANYLPLLTLAQWIILGALSSIFGTWGDLIQSKLKRQAGVKDSGNLMPGHGGILDRLDSILYTATFAYTYLYFIKYVS
ncbi:phosphatidate cytidylyltransferase [Mesonia sediminis]|uniref:Phosphatidate cytidylyltransferase n=1 Tax=Mesonia sediminis TaxID=1703946 RepID=A0ABW5SDX0_9FLAO